MAKDPAFLFYPKDWKSGTSEMTPQEKGVYIDLLCHQHQNGSLPCDIDRIRNIVGIDAQTFKKIWDVVSSKFYESNGRLYNAKLMEVMGERSSKAKVNKIIGTFGAIIKKSRADYAIQQEIRKAFNPSDFVEIESERLSERLTEWYNKRLAFLGNGNGDVNNSTTQEGGTGGTIKPLRLTHLDLFLQSTPDIESMVKYAKGIGKVLTVDRIKQLAASHDIQHKIAKPNGTYGQWRQYFMYFLSSHKEPFKPVNSEAPKYRLYTPPTE